ncbi:MAG: hypothetical protein Q9201_001631 [Fulgogasparrea decipioides]
MFTWYGHERSVRSSPGKATSQSVRNQLVDPKTMLRTYEGQGFVSFETVKRILTTEHILENVLRDQQDSPALVERLRRDIPAIENSRILFAVLLLAGLEQYYTELLSNGIKDEALFDEDSFKAFCQHARLRDIHKDSLRAHRNRFGAVLHQGRRPVISKGVVLPYLERSKKNNGSYGTIYKVKSAPGHLRAFDETSVAEKVIRPSDLGVGNREEWNRLCREAITLEKRQHPNITPLLASYFKESEESETDIKTLHLIFPWADMDLKTWMACGPTQNSAEDAPIRIDLYRQIYALVSGLSYLHREIAGEFTSHHDIKPNNILVFGREFKLADFGNSHLRPLDVGSDTGRDPLGTYEYHPPEYWKDHGFRANKRHGRAFDAWAIGCVIIELAILIFHGWDSQHIEQFRKARLENHAKDRPMLLQDDSSFHNNQNIVDKWVEEIKYNGSKRVTDLISVAEGLMAKDPRSRLYTWEAELDLYLIYHIDADRPKRLERNALCVQRPPRKIPNGTSTPLHRAAQRKDCDRVKDLLEHGWPFFVQDRGGQTPADIIAQDPNVMAKACLETYGLYFESGKCIKATNQKENDFFDHLRQNNMEQVEILLKEGISPTITDDEGHTATHLVTVNGNTRMLELLLNFVDRSQLRRRDRKMGLTPLQAAASKGYADKTEVLINYHLNNKYSANAKKDYAPDIEGRTLDGKTALFLAVERGHLSATDVLMAYEAQLFTQCQLGNTPIHAIASAEEVDKTEGVLERLLNVEEAAQCLEHRNHLGETPIALALSRQNFGCFRLLKEKGATIHIVNNKGENLLHIMARKGHHAFMEQYINEFEPTELTAQDHEKATPWMIAKKFQNRECLALLESRHLGLTDRGALRNSIQIANEQPNFYTLEAGEPWLSWYGQKSYWEHLTYDSYVVYEAIYERCRQSHSSVQFTDFTKQFYKGWPDVRVTRRIWQRLLRPSHVGIEQTSHRKAFVLAVLYMLHLENYHKSETPQGCNEQQGKVTDKRANMLTRFDLWIKCHCSTDCCKEWNFVNKLGMFRPREEQTPPCKAALALQEPHGTKKEKWHTPFQGGRGGQKLLENMYEEWKSHG